MTERSRTYTYDIRPVDLQVMAGMTGLEYIQKIFSRELPGATIAYTLDFYPVEVELGRAVFGGEPSEFVYNPIGSVHGGYAATMIDSALGCAIHGHDHHEQHKNQHNCAKNHDRQIIDAAHTGVFINSLRRGIRGKKF